MRSQPQRTGAVIVNYGNMRKVLHYSYCILSICYASSPTPSLSLAQPSLGTTQRRPHSPPYVSPLCRKQLWFFPPCAYCHVHRGCLVAPDDVHTSRPFSYPVDLAFLSRLSTTLSLGAAPPPSLSLGVASDRQAMSLPARCTKHPRAFPLLRPGQAGGPSCEPMRSVDRSEKTRQTRGGGQGQ